MKFPSSTEFSSMSTLDLFNFDDEKYEVMVDSSHPVRPNET